MARYYWPLTKEQDRTVRGRLIGRVKDRHHRNWEPLYDDEVPLLNQPSGREALAFYRAQNADWWANEAATFEDRARWHARQYAALIRRYGPANTLAVVA